MFPFQALIFDLDGTLADSLADIADAMNGALAARGLPTHPLDAFRTMVGEGAEVLAQRALPPGASLPVKTLVDEYRSHYERQAHSRSHAYPGVEAMLAALVERRVKLAVLSNKRDDFTKDLVARRFSGVPFVDVRGERDGVPRKPNPIAALELALALNVLPARIGFVGDTPIDVGTARAAGMSSIGVTWGFRSRAELLAAGSRVIVDTPAELLALR
jgi:phosphoglycolate phosphatase